MPAIQPNPAANYRAFLNDTTRDTEPAAPRLTLLERAARFSRKQAVGMALQRVVGGNIPLQGLVAAAGSAQGIRRIATEAGAGLISPQALKAYAAKDAASFVAEALLGSQATWVTRMPRWVARALACAAAAPLDGLRGADLLPWLGRPDYEYPMHCATFPRPTGCPSHTPGDLADWIEPAVAAVMIGAAAYWVVPRVAYHLQQKLTRTAPSATLEAAPEDLEGALSQPLLAAEDATENATAVANATAAESPKTPALPRAHSI